MKKLLGFQFTCFLLAPILCPSRAKPRSCAKGFCIKEGHPAGNAESHSKAMATKPTRRYKRRAYNIISHITLRKVTSFCGNPNPAAEPACWFHASSPAVASATFHETLHPQNSGAVMRGSRRWNCGKNVNSWGSAIFINNASCKLCCFRTYLWTKFWLAKLQSFPHMGATVGDLYWC